MWRMLTRHNTSFDGGVGAYVPRQNRFVVAAVCASRDAKDIRSPHREGQLTLNSSSTSASLLAAGRKEGCFELRLNYAELCHTSSTAAKAEVRCFELVLQQPTFWDAIPHITSVRNLSHWQVVDDQCAVIWLVVAAKCKALGGI